MIWDVADDCVAAAVAMAERLAVMPTRALTATRHLMRDAGSRTLDQQLDVERDTQSALGRTHDYFEGVKAFADHPGKSEEADRPERSVRGIVLCDDDEAGSEFVDTMDDARPDASASIGKTAEMVHQCMGKRAAAYPSAGVHHHAGRFFDDGNIGIFEIDLERDVLRYQ